MFHLIDLFGLGTCSKNWKYYSSQPHRITGLYDTRDSSNPGKQPGSWGWLVAVLPALLYTVCFLP